MDAREYRRVQRHRIRVTVPKGTTPRWTAVPIPIAPISHLWRPQSVCRLPALRREARVLVLDPGAVSTQAWELAERVVLALDELASNGLRHGSPPVSVTLCNHPDGWLVIVSDTAIDHLPAPASDRPASHGGYGLHVIAELSIVHGVARDDHFKHVWALLPRA
jgi:hypothetical protein